MTEKRYFVVRTGGIRYAIETGRHKETEHQRRRPEEAGVRVEYETEIPPSMTLREATRLYESGVRAKAPPVSAKEKLVLADVMAEKRARRLLAK